jgi:hypothetical protein
MNSNYRLRDELLRTLNRTYAPDFAGRDWYFCKYRDTVNVAVDLNMQLVTDIFALVAFAHLDSENNPRVRYTKRSLGYEIRNMIWTSHPGGTTAAAVANDVCKLLNIDMERNSDEYN